MSAGHSKKLGPGRKLTDAEKTRRWRRNHLEQLRRKDRYAYKKNREKILASYRQAKADAIAAYGGKCACCGEASLCFLTLDHVFNDGAAHRKKAGLGRASWSIYRYLRRRGYPQDGRFQVLCYNCNCAKQHDPIGHRAAHENAKNIDGLPEDIRGYVMSVKCQWKPSKDNEKGLFDELP